MAIVPVDAHENTGGRELFRFAGLPGQVGGGRDFDPEARQAGMDLFGRRQYQGLGRAVAIR